MPKPKKTYLRNYKCAECGKKIDDSKAEVGLMPQHFCSPKCQETFQKREQKEIIAQRKSDDYYKSLKPPVQDY